MFTRLPSAMFASTRCSPHAGSGVLFSVGAPPRGVMSSTCAPFSSKQPALKEPGMEIHGVGAFGTVKPTASVARPIVLPGANGLLGKIGSILAEPPPSRAGLVH